MTQQATSPFVQPSASSMIGLGVPIVQVYDVTALTASGTITLTPVNPFTKARLRIKSSAINAATTIAIGNITLTDGTSVVIVSTGIVATTATAGLFDINREILTDIQATSISFTVTLAGGTTIATISSELYANP